MANKVKVKEKVKLARRGRKSTSKLSIKNQLTVPVDILRQVGIQAGDEVEFLLNGAGFIEVRPVEENRLLGLSEKYGYLFKGFDLAKERQSWNR
jgi:bifunctional DNA-binding transcriptional regulator/antitoxin component of YhaV-PrlF toxin-antitoxin module